MKPTFYLIDNGVILSQYIWYDVNKFNSTHPACGMVFEI
jgi:hypothetical protein